MRLNAQERRIMGTKMGIAVGFGIGYVLGTRAGREQYARICACAGKLRRFPLVARPLDAAGEKMSALVRTQGEKVTDKVADAVKERLFRMPASEPEITEDDLPTYAG
jgi:putative protoporphyrinogen oxidase